MADNPLLTKGARESKLTAAEWAALCREKGELEKAKAWDLRAAELGEDRIPNGVTVRFNEAKEKYRGWIKA